MGIVNLNTYLTNKQFHLNPIVVQINCDKGQYEALGYSLYVTVPGAIPNKRGGYYSPGDQIQFEQTRGHEGEYKKLLNLRYQRSFYSVDATEESIREACRTQNNSTAGYTNIVNNGNGTFTATMPDGTKVTWSSSTGKGFDGVVDIFGDLPDPTQHKDQIWYVINTTLPSAMGNVWRSDGNDWISSLTLLKTKGDLLTFSTEQDILPLGTNLYILSVDITTPTGFKYVPYTPLPVSLGTPNQLLGMNNAGTALEYKTVSTSGTAVANDVGVTLTTPNQLVINLPSASATVRGVLTSTDWTTFNSKLTSTLSNTKIFIGSAGNVATEQTLSLNATGGLFALAASGILTMPNADTSTRGLLSSTDWNTFNNKQPAGSYITALTGDVTASGPGSAAATLATVNGNVGSFTYASITVNAKGLITAASSGTNPSGVYLPLAGGTMSGAILFSPDNTIDIGASGATRARTLYLGTSVFTPLVVGGTTSTSTLTLKSTTAAGTTGADIIFLVGNNGATEAMRILNSGNVVMGATSTSRKLEIVTASSLGLKIQTTGATIISPSFGLIDNTNGVDMIWSVSSTTGVIGTFSNHTFSIVTNQTVRATMSNTLWGTVTGVINGKTTDNTFLALSGGSDNSSAQGLINVFGKSHATTPSRVDIYGDVITMANATSPFAENFRMTSNRFGFGVPAPTAIIHIKAGTSSANTAPFKIDSGTNLTTPVGGVLEYNNTFHLTNSDATRRHIVLAPNTTKVTAGAPYTNDGYIVMNIGGTDFKIMTTA